jgi:putative ABC transport system permease protein
MESWLRTLLALRAYRTVLVAVVAAAVLAGLAGAASPLVTTVVASEAFENELAGLSPLAVGLELDSVERWDRTPKAEELERRAAARDRAVARLAERLDGVGPPVVTALVPERDGQLMASAKGFYGVRLMARTGALDHVRVLAQTGGEGVWISHRVAQQLGVRPGDRFRLQEAGAVSARVKGIYRQLSDEPESPYWVNFFQDIYPPDPDSLPAAAFAFTSRAELLRIASALGAQPIRHVYELPVAPGRVTLARARELQDQFAAVASSIDRGDTELARKLRCRAPLEAFGPSSPNTCASASSLSSAVLLADSSVSAVSPVVTLLSALGIGIALAVAAATGAFAVRRRRVEAELRFARGEHVARFAARTASEALLPLAAGAALGFALALALTDVLAPRGALDDGTVRSAAGQTALVAAAALALLAGAAGLAFVRLHETGFRARRWLRRVPWELPVLLLGGLLLARIVTGAGLQQSGASETQHPTLAVFLCPLLLVAGTTGLAVRVCRALLGGGDGRRGRGLPVALYLAVRRLAAARGLLVVLAVLGAVAFGGLVYAESLARSLDETTDQKAYIAHGSDVEAIVQGSEVIPKGFPYPVTRVQYDNAAAAANSVTGPQVDVVLVDPATLRDAMRWRGSWGPNPADLVDRLEPHGGSVPVIVTGELPPLRRLAVAGALLPVEVVGEVRAFPGTNTSPAVITTSDALLAASRRAGAGDPLELPRTYFWAKGPPREVAQALLASGVDTYAIVTADQFRRDADVALATRTYSYMRIVALAAGILAVAGLLLYLQARQRSQVIASALSRRMGFDRRREMLSLSLELAAIVAFCAVVGATVALLAAGPIVRELDPLPQFAPSPVFAIPVGAILAAAGALAAVALVAGALTSWLARRADPVEALRVD